jgi:AAA domain
VLAPYNAQVCCPREQLQTGVRVGTVDKFQGQEGAVAIYSLATSSAEELPRNLTFLFSRNRLNVAVSRARCLAFVVYSPRLLDAPARSIKEMRLINALCLLVETAAQAPRQLTSHPPSRRLYARRAQAGKHAGRQGTHAPKASAYRCLQAEPRLGQTGDTGRGGAVGSRGNPLESRALALGLRPAIHDLLLASLHGPSLLSPGSAREPRGENENRSLLVCQARTAGLVANPLRNCENMARRAVLGTPS